MMPIRQVWLLAAVYGCWPLTVGAHDPVAVRPAAPIEYESQVRPLLTKYCLACHQGPDADGGVTVDAYRPEDAGTKDRAIWSKVLRQVESRVMPPPDEAQPTDDERRVLVDWIRHQALAVDCSGPAYPGRVTLRRLNRTEYNHTIRDLLGVDFRPADNFPADDIGYGFDHIGDVLSLPPVLLERYLDAAEQVVRKALRVPDADFAPVVDGPGGVLSSTAEVGQEFEFPVAADYVFRAVAGGDQAGDELVRMVFRLDGQDQETVEVPVAAGAPEAYELRRQVPAGRHRVAVAFVNDYYAPNHPDPKLRGDRNLHVQRLSVVGPIGVLPPDLPESHQRLFGRTPAADAGADEQRACAREILAGFLPRAFRRPVPADELEPWLRLFEQVKSDGVSFERAVQVTVQAVLVSPHFLFRVERDPEAGPLPAIRTLDDFELASRLSYFLWSTMPDAPLWEQAARGTLGRDEVLSAELVRMLRDPRSQALIANFGGQWLQLRSLEQVSPDRRRFRGFDDELRQAMRRETELLLETVIREDRSIFELLSADFTFVNERLARHYGMTGIEGSEFQRVNVDLAQRGGLLGHASILTVTSNPTRTSPVKRGKWILENLLAAPPPPPPANVPPLAENREARESASLRERMEAHRRDPGCATCHQLMDPLGFGLENYDAIGSWRTEDGTFPIDPSGVLPDGRTFRGVAELRAVLLERRDDFRRCLVEKLLTYALGRGLEYFDECTVRQICRELEAGGDRFSALVTAIVRCEPFRKRAATALPEGTEPGG